MSLAGPLANIIDTLNDDVIDNLTSVPIDKDNPLIDNESFVLELDLNCFKHLHTSDNIVQNRLGRVHTTRLEHQNQRLCATLYLCAHVKTGDDKVGSNLQELCAAVDVFSRELNIQHRIRIHLDNPVNQLDIVRVDLHGELFLQ